MRPRFSIGGSDFEKLRKSGGYYVDKTDLIRDLIDGSWEVVLLPRPRRFGKTLNMSTLKAYFERSDLDRSALFEGLSIWEAGDEYRRHFQRYPTIFATFKDAKGASWEKCRALIEDEIIRMFSSSLALISSSELTPPKTAAIQAILDRRASDAILGKSLQLLSELLARTSGEQIVILIDEYDTPLHAAVLGGYESEALDFFRVFLSAGLKDNAHLFRGVLTGVLRIARESVFSGLNNLAVYSITRREMSLHFGFTEGEIADLLKAAGRSELMEQIRAWYDGYRFGGQVIYNPWSVLSFVDSEDAKFRPYWVSTSSDHLLRELLTGGRIPNLHNDMELLLQGGTIEKPIEENVSFRDVATRPGAVWSFLLFSGYLRASSLRDDDEGTLFATLEIPNREVLLTYRTLFQSWLDKALGAEGQAESLSRALLTGNAEELSVSLTALMTRCLSYHDTSGPEVEKVYQAFIVGLLVHLEPKYFVRSNRESGYGRYDVMILPKTPNQPGAILELKTLGHQDVETALTSALDQLRTRNYAAELREHGASPIHELAVVFDGKRAWVRTGSAD